MRILLSLISLALTSSATFAAETAPSAIVSDREERAFAVTESVRTNGSKMELWRYIKDKPHMQGYWIQHVYVGEERVFRIEHSAIEKEQSLVIDEGTNYGVIQIDRDLDGKYEMLIVGSHKDEKLVDVLYVTKDGWLRHSTPNEFQERLHIGERNRKGLEELDKTFRGALRKANENLNK